MSSSVGEFTLNSLVASLDKFLVWTTSVGFSSDLVFFVWFRIISVLASVWKSSHLVCFDFQKFGDLS